MVVKKKSNTSMEPPTLVEGPATVNNAIIPTNTGNNNREDNSEDTSVDDLTDGEVEVKLLDMGIMTKDIQAMRRIDACLACLAQWSCQARQAATQADQSTAAMTTKAKESKRHSPLKSWRSNLTSSERKSFTATRCDSKSASPWRCYSKTRPLALSQYLSYSSPTSLPGEYRMMQK
jgi:hypothetical protein